MPVAGWNPPRAISGDLIATMTGTSVNSLAIGGTSGFMTYDNATNLDPYAYVLYQLASYTSAAPNTLILRAFPTAGVPGSEVIPDNTAGIGGGEPYSDLVTVGASAKVGIFKVRLFNCIMKFALTNNTGGILAASGNTIKVQGYKENII